MEDHFKQTDDTPLEAFRFSAEYLKNLSDNHSIRFGVQPQIFNISGDFTYDTLSVLNNTWGSYSNLENSINLNQNIESGDIDLVTIVDDEIVSLKSGEIGDEDIAPVTFGCNTTNFRFRMMKQRFDSDCLTITSSGDDYPKEIIIDYGEGCEGRHGLVRTGKIIITMSDDILNEGAIHEVIYENVTMGDRQIEMSKVKTNAGQNADENWMIESSMEQTITYEDGSASTRNSSSANEWLSGFGTEDREDDMFLRTGSGTVVTSEGAEYTRDITTALLFDRSCLYIKSGVIELNKDGSEVIIDFGDGECDQWATVTTDGVSKIIDLSLRGRGMRGFRGIGK